MKIAFGVRNFRMVGGAERVILRLVDYLKTRGHRIVVYAITGQPQDGVELHLLPKPRFSPHYRRAWDTGQRISAALAAAEVDVTFGEQKIWNANVVRPGGGIEAKYWEYLLARQWGAGPWARLLGGLVAKRRYDLRAERLSLLGPANRAIIVNSDLVRRDLVRWYPEAAGRVRVVHNGAPAGAIDPVQAARARSELRRQHKLPATARVALFMGHDFHRKGLEAALQAVAAARTLAPHADWRLLVAGRGRPATYRARARRLGVANQVCFLGNQGAADIAYAAADVLLFPSHYDPFANVTVEALAAGLPVITTAANGGCEVIRPGFNGWVVPSPADIAPMAAHLAELADPARLETLRHNARLSAAGCRLEDRLREIEQVLLETAAAR